MSIEPEAKPAPSSSNNPSQTTQQVQTESKQPNYSALIADAGNLFDSQVPNSYRQVIHQILILDFSREIKLIRQPLGASKSFSSTTAILRSTATI